MAIDRIPGVGPQNTDIATAVAAAVPTAAAITSTVQTYAASAGVTLAAITSSITTNAASAGLTNASITAAGNAAGWGATGPTTTQIAAAVPTLAQINTSVATNAPSPNAYTYITSLAGTTAAGVNFTGLSGYKVYKLYGSFASGTTGWPVVIEVNGVTTAFYGYGASVTSGGTWSASVVDGVGRISPWGNLNSSGPHHLEFTIGNANLSSPATFNTKAYMRGSGVASYWNIDGFRGGNGPITSIRVYDPNNVQVVVGTFYLYGGN